MQRLFVIDTSGLISFFDEIFPKNHELSRSTRNIISNALYDSFSEYRISIPSIVFIEIFEKWFEIEEFRYKFYYEVFTIIDQSQNFEIRSIDQEILLNIIKIEGRLSKHDLHDKIVLASAIALNCPLITSDEQIKLYVRESNLIPDVIF